MLDGWTKLCDAGHVPEGEHRAIFIDDKRLCAVNDGESYFVVDDLCTHGVAYLSDGYCDTDEMVVECPLHGGLFCYKSGNASGKPAEKPVRRYPVQIVDGQVMVQL